MASITIKDIQRAWKILKRWKSEARALKKDTTDLDHIIKVINRLTGGSK